MLSDPVLKPTVTDTSVTRTLLVRLAKTPASSAGVMKVRLVSVPPGWAATPGMTTPGAAVFSAMVVWPCGSEPVSPLPVTVIVVPPAIGPDEGEMEVTTGPW